MKAKILVADDSATIQKIVAMSFENEDISVVGVNNGKQAFDKMYEVRPDIVLADTDMPGLTGYQLSQKIKESKEFGSVRVLLLTSDFGDFNEGLYKSCKADGHISKPFKSDEIVKKVNELLQQVSGSQDADEPELISLSVMDIVDDADLPQAILLDEGAMVSTDSIVDETPKKAPSKTEDEFNLDDIFNDPFGSDTASVPESAKSSVDETPKKVPSKSEDEFNLDDIFNNPFGSDTASAPESAKSSEPIGEPEFDETATLADMVKEIEGMDWPDSGVQGGDIASLDEAALFEKSGDTGVFDKVVDDLEKLKWQEPVTPAKTEKKVEREPEDADSLAEISDTRVESLDELDQVFNQLKSSESAGSGVPKTETQKAAKSKLKNVEPEPDDLLEKMAPSAFSRQSPDLIKESLTYLSEHKLGRKNGKKEDGADQLTARSPILDATEGKLDLILGDQINAILEKSLGSAIKSEVAGLSDIILQSVREVVREVTPQIAREIIREEIEKIRDIEGM